MLPEMLRLVLDGLNRLERATEANSRRVDEAMVRHEAQDNVRFNSLDKELDVMKTQIQRWVGGLGVFTFLFGALIALYEIIKPFKP
jgi:hypothetical protein